MELQSSKYGTFAFGTGRYDGVALGTCKFQSLSYTFGTPKFQCGEELEKRLDMAKLWVREVFKKSYKMFMDGKGGTGKYVTILAAILAVRRDRATRSSTTSTAMKD